ncbi:hypothetical protein [Kitasatospora brasiliensis]|uniref:hypothetical protein n=1 Tax=Kitasatospora brasiliensis TaxID=3058040 RepID=UPI00292FB4C9|nr:hypothetical protein [Kitasatospora sp. K002]
MRTRTLAPRAGVVLGAALMAAGLLGGTAQAAQAAPAAGTAASTAAVTTVAAAVSDGNQTVVQPNSGLGRGQGWGSPDGSTAVFQQNDGHVVLYHNGVAIWTAVGTYGIGTSFFMQGDGNLVAYDAAMRPLWNSKTAGHPGAYLAIQNSGNMVVYSGSTPLWWSNFNPNGSGPVDPGPDDCIPTPNRRCP